MVNELNSPQIKQRFKQRPLYTAVIAGTLVMAGATTLATKSTQAAGNNPSAQIVLAANEAVDPCNPCAVKKLNPCAAKACNPCAAKACNPCAAKACNPCAAKACNPCAAKACNPCAAKACNPCAAKACNPCAAKACNPCAAKACNPCAASACNPCGAGAIKAEQFVRPSDLPFSAANIASLAPLGKRLWNDTSLSSNGLACQSCHNGDAQFNATFTNPYPHEVAMPKQMAGVSSVDIDEMVNFCMLAPMASEPIAWNTMELLALSAYALEVQAGFNPCAAKAAKACNPCAAKACNPCAAKACNPCAAKACNPCAAKACNPCAAKACNPCAAKN